MGTTPALPHLRRSGKPLPRPRQGVVAIMTSTSPLNQVTFWVQIRSCASPLSDHLAGLAWWGIAGIGRGAGARFGCPGPGGGKITMGSHSLSPYHTTRRSSGLSFTIGAVAICSGSMPRTRTIWWCVRSGASFKQEEQILFRCDVFNDWPFFSSHHFWWCDHSSLLPPESYM